MSAILLEDRTGKTDREYTQERQRASRLSPRSQSVEHRPVHPDMNGEMEKVARQCFRRRSGRRPYANFGRQALNPTGALGYVNCAMGVDRSAQVISVWKSITSFTPRAAQARRPASSLASCGMRFFGVPLLGIGRFAPLAKSRKRTSLKLATATCDKIEIAGAVKREDVVANCDYVGKGYGFPGPHYNQCDPLLACTEESCFDPVYSGKGPYGGLYRSYSIADYSNVGRAIVFCILAGRSS